MSDQETIDAIDAEIARVEVNASAGLVWFYFDCVRYVNGLGFARALIVKRMEGGK